MSTAGYIRHLGTEFSQVDALYSIPTITLAQHELWCKELREAQWESIDHLVHGLGLTVVPPSEVIRLEEDLEHMLQELRVIRSAAARLRPTGPQWHDWSRTRLLLAEAASFSGPARHANNGTMIPGHSWEEELRGEAKARTMEVRIQIDRILEARRDSILLAFAHGRFAVDRCAFASTEQTWRDGHLCIDTTRKLLIHDASSSRAFSPLAKALAALEETMWNTRDGLVGEASQW